MCYHLRLFWSSVTNKRLFKGGEGKGRYLNGRSRLPGRYNFFLQTPSGPQHTLPQILIKRQHQHQNQHHKQRQQQQERQPPQTPSQEETISHVVRSLLKLQVLEIRSTYLPMLCQTDQLIKRQYVCLFSSKLPLAAWWRL